LGSKFGNQNFQEGINMLRKGFTLIELLIVITIIAILAGAAIPYVQDYVEDARIAKARADMNEIKNALIRFELDRGIEYTPATIADLVGPYMDKAVADPWGTPYEVVTTDSRVYSWGPNRSDDAGAGDDLAVEFRPPMAITKAYFIDVDNSGSVTQNDTIKIRFSRPYTVADVAAIDGTSFGIGIDGAAPVPIGAAVDATAAAAGSKEIVLTLANAAPPAFFTGRDTIAYMATGDLHDQTLVPAGGIECRTNEYVIKPLK